MAKRISDKEKIVNTYNYLQKRRKAIKRRSLFFAIFVLGVNIYAWFTYISRANLQINANVVSWDIKFIDNNTMVKDITVNIDDMYPGMLTYTKKLTISNSSDLTAKFEYKITKLTVRGKEIAVDDNDHEKVVNDLASSYPFTINFNATKTSLKKDENLEFEFKMDWEYESVETKYYKLTEYYEYDSTINYYILSNGEYVIDDTVSATNFIGRRDTLYLQKDDADSYWGTSCAVYREKYNKPCIQLEVILFAKQSN